jgi:imidazolonepropionase-like amidohydrolase
MSLNFSLPLCIPWLVLAFLPGVSSAQDLRIDHVTIVSPERSSAMRDASVRVRDGRIVAIAKTGGASAARRTDALVIDGSGLFLAPGLIDTHVHLGAIPGMRPDQEAEHPEIASAAREQIPRSYLLLGFTTLVDVISTPQAMASWKSHDLVPNTYFCGGAALMDGYAMNYSPKPQRYQEWPYMLIEPGSQAPDGIDPAMHTPQAVVARMKADGAICVKTFFERGFDADRNLPVPKLETIRALVEAAHAAGMPVLMHGNSDEAHKFGVEAGVDIMAHGLWNWYQENSATSELTPGIKKIIDDEIAKDMGWQPTMQVLQGIQDLFSTSFLSDPMLARVLPSNLIDWYRTPEGQWLRESMVKDQKLPADASPVETEQTINRRMHVVIDRGKNATAYVLLHHGRILFATDTPSAPTFANPPGLNGWLEMHRLVGAGETPAQIFKSATLNNANALNLGREIGTVQVGKRANLLLLRQDPTMTIDAYTAIIKVILDGRVLEASELAANARLDTRVKHTYN